MQNETVGCFKSSYRESKCWSSAKWSSIKTKYPYSLEISGFHVGFCRDASTIENKLILTGFVGDIKKWSGLQPRSRSNTYNVS